MGKLIIVGTSGHGKVVADIALRDGCRDIAEPGTYVGGSAFKPRHLYRLLCSR